MSAAFGAYSISSSAAADNTPDRCQVRLLHHFLWRWRKSINCVFRLLVERSGKNSKQPLEGCPIGTLHGSVERLFHAMVAGNILRAHAAHVFAPLGRSAAFNRKSLAPFDSPAVEC